MTLSRMRFSVLFITALLLVLSLSCDKNNPTSSGIVVLQLSENPITIAVGYYKTIGISGGSGYYVITSISDSSIAMFQINGQYLSLEGRKIGTTSITVEDSAKNAKVDVLVTVSIMAASPSQVNIKVRDYEVVNIVGGTSPYQITSEPNSLVAVLEDFHSGSYEIRGVAPGSTFMTVVDNANPKNSVTIPIYVTARPKFTAAGAMSFQSDRGNFEANGIYTVADDLEGFPTNNEGAGGFLTFFSESGNFCQIVGYKKRSEALIDAVVIVIIKSSLTAGTLQIDSLFSQSENAAYCLVTFNANITTQVVNEQYMLVNGSVILSQYTSSKAAGTFSGSGPKIQDGNPVAGAGITVSNGTFNVPLLAETEPFAKSGAEQQRIEQWAKKFISKHNKNLFLNGTGKKQQ